MEKHNLTVLQETKPKNRATDNNEVEANKFPTDVAPFVNAAGEITGDSGPLGMVAVVVLGRITYSYAGKSLFT